ncbi:MAG: class I SAM-dependent methyltransferase [Solirubrobacterales bacterium]|nr:class I SAM-dependent methyltransferase [Solirubrobacterales bacterium]
MEPDSDGRFSAPAEQYDRFMGRYAPTLAAALADAAAVAAGMRVLDVGCGPGGLTNELSRRVGTENVAAVDPAPQFVAACRERHRGADVREGVAERLPWPDASFDAALSSLVIAFMRDPDRGIGEMARVTRSGGTVAACMWDIASGGMTMLRIFWNAVREVEPSVDGEQRLAGTVEGDIVARFERLGLEDVVGTTLVASADYVGFDDFWEPFTFAVGPSGRYLAKLSRAQRMRVRDACRTALPDGRFSLEARAWCARGTVPAPDRGRARSAPNGESRLTGCSLRGRCSRAYVSAATVAREGARWPRYSLREPRFRVRTS